MIPKCVTLYSVSVLDNLYWYFFKKEIWLIEWCNYNIVLWWIMKAAIICLKLQSILLQAVILHRDIYNINDNHESSLALFRAEFPETHFSWENFIRGSC